MSLGLGEGRGQSLSRRLGQELDWVLSVLGQGRGMGLVHGRVRAGASNRDEGKAKTDRHVNTENL